MDTIPGVKTTGQAVRLVDDIREGADAVFSGAVLQHVHFLAKALIADLALMRPLFTVHRAHVLVKVPAPSEVLATDVTFMPRSGTSGASRTTTASLSNRMR